MTCTPEAVLELVVLMRQQIERSPGLSHAPFSPEAWAVLEKALRDSITMPRKAAALWRLLDDIDTASDMFKDNYAGLAGYVYRKQRRRFEIMSGEEFAAVPT